MCVSGRGANNASLFLAWLFLASPAQAEPIAEDIVARLLAQTLVNSQFNANESTRTVLDINSRTNEIREFRVLGSSFSISTCHDLILASTDFRSDKGEVTPGNYVLQLQGEALRVIYQSFGDDRSLDRIRKDDCRTINFGGPLLRPTIIATDDRTEYSPSAPPSAGANPQ